MWYSYWHHGGAPGLKLVALGHNPRKFGAEGGLGMTGSRALGLLRPREQLRLAAGPAFLLLLRSTAATGSTQMSKLEAELANI